MEVLSEREALDVRVAAVAFAPGRRLGRYADRFGLTDAVLLSDPERSLYRALGLGRGSVARVWLDPRVWRRYGQLLLRGRRPRPPAQDTLQLGGDAVLDPEGRVRWVYRSRGPDDRPAVDEVVAAVRAARGAARAVS